MCKIQVSFFFEVSGLFFANILNLQLVESINGEPVDVEGDDYLGGEQTSFAP